jgi:hypothetical protein
VKIVQKISDLFEVKYGVNLELNSLTMCNPDNINAVNFVSRTAINNGVSAIVEKIAFLEPIPAGTISVACGGSVMAAFLQPKPYYSGRDLFFLTPKKEMTDLQKLYYVACIRANKYKYNYGRQANKTLKDILIPNLDEIPSYVSTIKIPNLSELNKSINHNNLNLDLKKWKLYKYSDLFEIKKGKRVTKLDIIPGETPFISAIDKNNGIREYAGLIKSHEGNTITVNYNGSVGEAFFQEVPFWASDDVNVLYSKFVLNKFIAMFIITLIRNEKYRFNYGRKWHKERMDESTIYLPCKDNGSPDFEFMEEYIKSLPNSRAI